MQLDWSKVWSFAQAVRQVPPQAICPWGHADEADALELVRGGTGLTGGCDGSWRSSACLPGAEIAGSRTGEDTNDIAGAAFDRLGGGAGERERLIAGQGDLEIDGAAGGDAGGRLGVASSGREAGLGEGAIFAKGELEDAIVVSERGWTTGGLAMDGQMTGSLRRCVRGDVRQCDREAAGAHGANRIAAGEPEARFRVQLSKRFESMVRRLRYAGYSDEGDQVVRVQTPFVQAPWPWI